MSWKAPARRSQALDVAGVSGPAIVLACSELAELEDWLVRAVHVCDADELLAHS